MYRHTSTNSAGHRIRTGQSSKNARVIGPISYFGRTDSQGCSYSSASEIQSYVKQTAKSQGLLRQVAFSHQVTRAEWISELGMWRLEIKGPDGRTFTDEGHFLFNGTGILK